MKAISMRLACLCLAVGTVDGSGGQQTDALAQKKTTRMGSMQQDVFGMDSRDYFSDPGKNFSDVGYSMADAGQQGLLLGGPDYVAHDKNDRFPVSCLHVAEALELRKNSFRSTAIIAAVGVGTGSFYADYLIEQKFKKEKWDPKASLPPPGISFEGSAGDLFARLEIPRHAAEYLVTGILLDRVSNRVRIRVGSEAARGDASRFASEAVEGTKSPRPRYRALAIRGTVKEPVSPPLPQAPGIHAAFSTPRGRPFAATDSLDLYVAYKLPHPASGPDGKPAAEIVFHILSTGTRVPTPGVMQAVIPILPANRAADGTVQGYFSLDLNQGRNFLGNQTYSVYLFSGEQLGAVPKVELP